MDWTKKNRGFSSHADPGRRSFLKLGVAASASLMTGCWSQASLTRSRASRITLLKGERDWAPSVCLLCPSGCAIRAYSESGRVVAIGGEPDDPNTGGRMCPIGLSMLNLHTNPDRLTSAFRKTADGKMAPARTDEVLNLIAAQIRRGGMLHIHGRITPFASELSKILNAACHLDAATEGTGNYPEFLNTDGRPPILDFENARIAFLFDCNILEHGIPFVGYIRRITEARLRGMRLVTLSPFLTNTATAGDWVPLRSSAAASAAALAIAQQALGDPSLSLNPPSREIADLLRSVDGQFLERSSGLSRKDIQELSRRFFSEPGPAISDTGDPFVLILNLLKGNLNRPGGLLHPGTPALRVRADSVDIAPILHDSRNVVILHRSNPAFDLSPDIGPILRSADRGTLVCIDSFLSETAELSDFVLPLASPLETLTITEPVPLDRPFLAAAAPSVQPGSSCRSLDDWLARLATAIFGSAPPLTPERFAAQSVLGACSMPLAANRAIYPMPAASRRPLEPNVPAIVKSMKSLIAAMSEIAALQPGQYLPALFEESVQGPATAPSKWLNEITYSPKIYLHPQRAGRLGIRSGDSVTLAGSSGKPVQGIALLFEGIHPDAAGIPLHHGHTAYGRVARGEPFSDTVDADMSRLFWGKNRGVHAAEFSGTIITIGKGRG
jgi:thiosulfate reductase / polysulfide reductase chain A